MLYVLMVIGQALARVVPTRIRWAIGGAISESIYWLWPAKRRATQENMSVVLGLPVEHAEVQRVARLSWRNYGRFSGDLFDISNHTTDFFLDRITDLSGPPAPDGTIRAFTVIDEARAKGKGVVIPTGHFGNWDIAGVVAATRGQLHVIADDLKDKRLNDMLQSQRNRMGMVVVNVSKATREIMQVLRAGGMVATPVDRPVPPDKGIPIQFFGRLTYVPRGMAAMACRTGATIVPGYGWYNPDGGFRVRVFEPRAFEGDKQIQAATQYIFDTLEIMIRQEPTQWYMFRPFWPEQEPATDTPAMAEAATDA
jgi:lauroyl/myristoyl acyltransferase